MVRLVFYEDHCGFLTGIIVMNHHEPYGYFSIDRPQFAAQFRGKDVHDLFRLGADVEACRVDHEHLECDASHPQQRAANRTTVAEPFSPRALSSMAVPWVDKAPGPL